jgi:hypothetical protein
MTERELARSAARCLAIIRHVGEVTGNVAKTCRYYGISRQAYFAQERGLRGGRFTAVLDHA